MNHWCNFDALQDLERFWSLWYFDSLFYKWKGYLVWAWWRRKAMGGKGWLNEWMNELMIKKVFVEQPLALPGSANYSSKSYIWLPRKPIQCIQLKVFNFPFYRNKQKNRFFKFMINLWSQPLLPPPSPSPSIDPIQTFSLCLFVKIMIHP